MTREVRHSPRELTKTLDQCTKGDDYDQSWNGHQQQQGKWDIVWENLLGRRIRARRAITTTKAEMDISDDRGSATWAERTYWDTWSEYERQQWRPRLKWIPVTAREARHSLRKLTEMPDQSTKGNNYDQSWNEHQQRQGKRDIVWENILGCWIRVWRAMTMTKAEMNTSNDRGSET